MNQSVLKLRFSKNGRKVRGGKRMITVLSFMSTRSKHSKEK